MRIDWWTLGLQTVNVLVLIWLLGRFFFRPIMDVVAKRQQEANALLSDAGHARDRAAEIQLAAEKANSEFTAARERLLAEARKAAEDEHGRLLAQSAQEIAKLRDEAASAIARERAAAEAAIIDRAGDLSIEIALRLLERFRRQDLLATFIDGIGCALTALSAQAREDFVSAATPDHPIEVVSAAPLSDPEVQRVQLAVRQACGRELPMVFRSDPEIVNGIELVGRNAVVRNSWRADLNRIRHELSRDKQDHQP